MERIECGVVRDLLPLYWEELAGPESKRLVEEHVARCPACAAQLRDLGERAPLPEDDGAAMARLKKKMDRRSWGVAALAVAIALAVVLALLAWLRAPIGLDYTAVGFAERDGLVLANLGPEVAGYALTEQPGETGTVYRITAWDSLWNRYVVRGEERSVALNPGREGERPLVEAVYYYRDRSGERTITEEDRLVYGTDSLAGAGTTLPRLALGAYGLMALAALILCAVTWLLCRGRERARYWLARLGAAPLAYLAAQLCVKGFHTASYSLQYDLLSILLLGAAIYAALVLGLGVAGKRRRRAD